MKMTENDLKKNDFRKIDFKIRLKEVSLQIKRQKSEVKV